MKTKKRKRKTNVSHWGNDPMFPVVDWQTEVANGDTRLGYTDWAISQHEVEDS